MAQKTTNRTQSNTEPKNADRYLAIVFFTLIQQALEKLDRARGQRDMELAAYDVQKLLKAAGDRLLRLFNQKPDGGRTAKALKQLFGFTNGYPSTPASTAWILGAEFSEQCVRNIEAEAFNTLAARSDDLIAKIREEWFQQHPCPNCKTKLGDPHVGGCKSEECPFCHTLLSSCACAYKYLKIKWGGKSEKEWRVLQRKHLTSFNFLEHARPLTILEQRQWAALVLQKGLVVYGSEQCFQ